MPIDKDIVARSKRPTRTQAVLQYLASSNGSLYYEVQMLNYAAKESLNTQSGFEHNVAVETFLVHFRNVRDFLYPASDSWTNDRKFDDVIAFDFCSDWLSVADDWKECSANERHRVNKLLAHISYSRPQLDHNWPVAYMVAVIRNSFAAFVSTLPPERKEWFSAYGA